MNQLVVEIGIILLTAFAFALVLWMMRGFLLDGDPPPWLEQRYRPQKVGDLLTKDELEIPMISENKLKHQQNLKLVKESPQRVESTIRKWLHEVDSSVHEQEYDA